MQNVIKKRWGTIYVVKMAATARTKSLTHAICIRYWLSCHCVIYLTFLV